MSSCCPRQFKATFDKYDLHDQNVVKYLMHIPDEKLTHNRKSDGEDDVKSG